MYVTNNLNLILKLINKSDFQKLVKKYNTDRYNHKFTSWQHFVTLIYSQLAGNKSLREIELGFNSRNTKQYHSSIKSEIKRSTLSYANNNRNYRIFEEMVLQMMVKANKRTKRDIKEMVSLIDSSPMQLRSAKLYQWTQNSNTSRIKGLKLHSEYDLHKAIPIHCEVSRANVDDKVPMRHWNLSSDRIYVFDKGYLDYGWWHKIISCKSSFVTRLHKTSKVTILYKEELSIEDQALGIKSSYIINIGNKSIPRLGKRHSNRMYGQKLRMVSVDRGEGNEDIVLLSNNLNLSPSQISDLYKARWDIETHFKWIKQRLNIKNFIGNSENAVKIQIYIALATYLLLSLFKDMMNLPKQSLKTILDILRHLLFSNPSEIVRYFNHLKPDKGKDISNIFNQLNLFSSSM